MELVRDRDLLLGTKRRARHQRLDEVPIAKVGRHPAGGRVRVREQARFLQRGKLVPYRRRRNVELVPPDELSRRHRLRGRDVLAHHRAEHLSGARIKLRKFSGIG